MTTTCILPAPVALLGDAVLVRAACEALALGDPAAAGLLVARLIANFRELSTQGYAEVLRRTAAASAPRPSDPIKGRRSISDRLVRAMVERDGHHCRYCELPVVTAANRRVLHEVAPGLFPWGARDAERHPTLLLLWATPDHVVPRSSGGSDDLDNLVTACFICQFSKFNFSLSALQLDDPRDRNPVQDHWDGLDAVVARLKERDRMRVADESFENPTWGDPVKNTVRVGKEDHGPVSLRPDP